jgi:hypothetical protein
LRWLAAAALLMVTFGAAALGYCALPMPDLALDENIATALGQPTFTTQDMIRFAREHTQVGVWLVAASGSSLYTTARYVCEQGDCQMREFITETAAARHVECFGRGPENGRLFTYTFDLQQQRVTLRTTTFDAGPDIRADRPETFTPSIEAALDSVRDELAALSRGPIFVSVARADGVWRIIAENAAGGQLWLTGRRYSVPG